MLTVGSLFSGIGGIDLGLERAGFDVRWQVEIDDYATRVLEKFWPETRRYRDVRDLSGSTLEAVDCIFGGFPCQPVSVAGKRKAQDDPRWLWPEYARLVDEIRPRYVVVENVPGIYTAGLSDVVSDLATLGFDAEWHSVPATAFGAPHVRERLVLVAVASGSGGGGIGRMVGDSGDQRGRAGTDWGEVVRPRDWSTYSDRSREGGEDVADSDREGLEGRGGSLSGSGEGTAPESRTEGGEGRGTAMADTDSERFRIGEEGYARPWIYPEGERDYPSARRTSLRVGTHWITDPANGPEPLMGRVAHGVPKRVDRLRGLGNSVVPQLFEWIGDLINDHADLSN